MAAVLSSTTPAQPVAQKDNFSITITIDEAIRRQILEGESIVSTAEACAIDCHDMAVFAQDRLNAAIAFGREFKARRDRLFVPALQIIEEAKAQCDPAINNAARAEQIYRKKLGDYQAEAKKKLEDQRRQQEEEARRAREQAEREAAAAKAKGDEAARKAREEAARAAAERERQEAEARRAREAGDKTAAAAAERKAQAAAAEQAKKEEEERQRREAGEREAERLQMEAAARAQTRPAPEAQKIGGTRETWAGGFADDCKGDTDETREIDAIEKIAKAIASGRRECIAYMKLHWPSINKAASSQKGLFNVPGLKSISSSSFVNRGKK